MEEYGDINLTTEEINNRLANGLLKTAQTLTDEEKRQVRNNLGLANISYELYNEQ